MNREEGDDTFHVWLLATVPGREPITLHGQSHIDGGIAGAFDRMVPDLVDALRDRVVNGS